LLLPSSDTELETLRIYYPGLVSKKPARRLFVTVSVKHFQVRRVNQLSAMHKGFGKVLRIIQYEFKVDVSAVFVQSVAFHHMFSAA
jgi:hypothetical protein